MKITIDLLYENIFADKLYSIENETFQMLNIQKYSTNINKIKQSGCYILLGPNILRRQIYIGQTTNLSRRLKEHQKSKDFWCECVCFYDSTNQLTKTEIEWLETELIKAAIMSNNYDVLTNYQIPANIFVNNDVQQLKLQKLLDYIKLYLQIFGLYIINENYENSDKTTSKNILDRIIKKFTVNSYKNDINNYEDEDGIIHVINENVNANYMIVANGFYLFKDSIINKNNLSEERLKLLKKYKNEIVNFTLQKDILIKNEKILKLLIG